MILTRTKHPDAEHALVRRVRHRLNREPDVFVMKHARARGQFTNARGEKVFLDAGLEDDAPDLVGVCGSRFFALEGKVPGRRPRPGQEQWAEKLRRYGAFVSWFDSVDTALAALARCRAGEDR